MKKRLEADLISIAHRILQLKNKSDVNQLFLETQKLYEKLAVLRFVEEQYGDIKPTIGRATIVSDVENFYENEAVETVTSTNIVDKNSTEETITETPTAEEVIVAVEVTTNAPEEDEINIVADEKIEAVAITEVAEDEIILETETEPITPPAFEPHFSLTEENEEEVEEKIEVEAVKKAEAIQISFEDLLGGDYNEPQFVKVDDVPVPTPSPVFEKVNNSTLVEEISSSTKTQSVVEKPAAKVVSLNDKFSKGIEIDLNDQIAFVKHLFGNSREDYNRVMSQIMTFDNFYETKAFIDEMVKPDYNDWKGKADYEERFMEIIEKKFL
ncbi:hypothetical protein [Flavobacterium faecale]|uniref:hypothetical protein n=1 Tax=Flavobacterium faecale TaxID=1355330 RepID=UPI003AACD71A